MENGLRAELDDHFLRSSGSCPTGWAPLAFLSNEVKVVSFEIRKILDFHAVSVDRERVDSCLDIISGRRGVALANSAPCRQKGYLRTRCIGFPNRTGFLRDSTRPVDCRQHFTPVPAFPTSVGERPILSHATK